MKFSTTIKPVSVNRRTVPGQHGKLITSNDYRNTKAAMKMVFRNQTNQKPFNGEVAVYINCGWKNYDVDSWVKIVLDSLQGIAYVNDNQVRFLQIAMMQNKKINIEVMEMGK